MHSAHLVKDVIYIVIRLTLYCSKMKMKEKKSVDEIDDYANQK